MATKLPSARTQIIYFVSCFIHAFIHSFGFFKFFEFQMNCIQKCKQTIKTKYESTSIINIPTETLPLFRQIFDGESC